MAHLENWLVKSWRRADAGHLAIPQPIRSHYGSRSAETPYVGIQLPYAQCVLFWPQEKRRELTAGSFFTAGFSAAGMPIAKAVELHKTVKSLREYMCVGAGVD